MTPLGPPRLAPKGTPEAVARYLDDAAAYLRPYVEDFSLELKPYENAEAHAGTWAHNLYGSQSGARYAIQLASNDDEAPSFIGTVTGYVMARGEDGAMGWMEVAARKATGMAGALEAIDAMYRFLRLACGFRAAYARHPAPRA